MARGDQIYVMRPLLGLNGVYEHHGIDCGDGTVIHYSKAGEVPTVKRTSYEAFSWGNPVYVKRHSVGYIPDVAIARAESRIGEQQYNLTTNNCEHFATWAKTGVNESAQLRSYGLDAANMSASESGKLVDEAARSGDPRVALSLFNQAMQNIAIAQSQLQPKYANLQKEIDTWNRVAQLALKQGREDLARAALDKKVKLKKQSGEVKAQLDQLVDMQQNLTRNLPTLEERGYEISVAN